jgi:hypothetical protein
MSTNLVCDECGQEIDETVTYVSAQIVHKQLIDDAMMTAGQQQLDWHTEHAPAAVAAEPET